MPDMGDGVEYSAEAFAAFEKLARGGGMIPEETQES
jgi:hypothetical protein